MSEFTVDGSGQAGVSITNDGVLTFSSFGKVGDTLITVTATNIAGSVNQTYTINLKQGSEPKNEVKMTIYTASYMPCVQTEAQIKAKVINTKEYTLSQSDFDNNVIYGIQFQFSSFLYGAYVIEGYVNFDTIGEHKILSDIDGISQVWLDDKLVIDDTSSVHSSTSGGNAISRTYTVENTGYVKFKVMGFIGYIYTCGSGGIVFLRYIKPGDSQQYSFVIYQSINIYEYIENSGN